MTHFPRRGVHTPPPEAMTTARKIYVMLTGVEVPRSFNGESPADYGQLDTRVTAEQARNVYDHLAGPKRLEWYEHAQHTSFINTDPERWDSAISDFLQHPAAAAGEHRE